MRSLVSIIEFNRKRGCVSAASLFIFLFFWKLLPKFFFTLHSHVILPFSFVCVLCLLSGVKIRLSETVNKVLGILMLIGSPALCFVVVEFLGENLFFKLSPMVILFNYLIYGLIFLILFVITNRLWAGVSLGTVLCIFCGLANGFVREFRGYGIRSCDMFAAKTALNVAGNYVFSITVSRGYAILAALALILIAIHIDFRIKSLKPRLITAVSVLCCLVIFQGIIRNDDFMKGHNLRPFVWEISNSQLQHGVFLDFISGLPTLTVDAPEGYSAAKAKELINSSEPEEKVFGIESDFSGEKPDIIVIMNESLSDLSVNGDFSTDVPYLENWNSLSDNVVKGYTSVPVFGSFTANSEFEFLTGYSCSLLPGGMVAYSNYVRESTVNLSDVLKEQGYHSIFMHPFVESGWNRSNVYKYFEFDEIYYISDWINKEYIRNFISDSADYKEVIYRYEEAKRTNDSVFLFNVTMQNHGGYDNSEYETTVHITDLEGNYPLTEQYLSLIRESDAALMELLNYFDNSEDPVLILLYGDHQPGIEAEFFEKVNLRHRGTEAEISGSKYLTPFLLYSNRELSGSLDSPISASYLQALLMEAADLETTDYQDFLRNMYLEFPVVNIHGSLDCNGTWYTWEEAESLEAVRDYETVQYNLLFDK